MHLGSAFAYTEDKTILQECIGRRRGRERKARLELLMEAAEEDL